MSFQERLYLIECINEKQAATKKAMDEIQAKQKTSKK